MSGPITYFACRLRLVDSNVTTTGSILATYAPAEG